MQTARRQADSWEMVIPKMGRPGASASRASLPLPAGPAKPAGEIPKKESGAFVGLLAIGGFARKITGEVSMAMKGALAAGIAIAIAATLIFTGADKPKAAQAPPPVARTIDPAAWIAGFAAPGGSQWGRQVSVLRSSLKSTDFLLEFQAQIENQALLGFLAMGGFAKNFKVEVSMAMKGALAAGIAIAMAATLIFTSTDKPKPAQAPTPVARTVDPTCTPADCG